MYIHHARYACSNMCYAIWYALSCVTYVNCCVCCAVVYCVVLCAMLCHALLSHVLYGRHGITEHNTQHDTSWCHPMPCRTTLYL